LISPGFRDDLAHRCDLMSPGARGVLAVWFLASAKPRGQLKSRLEGHLCLLLSACGQRSCVVQAQRHVHSATGSGLSAGFTGSPQALSVEVNPVGVMDQAVEDGVGIGRVSDTSRAWRIASRSVGIQVPLRKAERRDRSGARRGRRHPGRHHPGIVGEIISEWRATSNRNGGRDRSRIVGDIERNQQWR